MRLFLRRHACSSLLPEFSKGGNLCDSRDIDRYPVLYILHSAEMYGTERMAIATASGLPREFRTIFLGPRGPATWEAERLGFEVHYFHSSRELIQRLRLLFERHARMTVVSTLPRFSLIAIGLNVVYRRSIRHVCVIHGSCDEKRDYGAIRWLNPFDVTFVAVSQFVREKLIEYGMPAHRIEVVRNFILPEQIENISKRGRFAAGIQRALCVGRTEYVKRFDVLLDAVSSQPELADFQVDVAGHGDLLDELRRRATAGRSAVRFLGFVENIEQRYATADLLIHPCPSESFGLVVLEAMAAGVPVLVADRGGPATFVEHGVTGFKYRAGDPHDLARQLIKLRSADAGCLNQVADNATREIETRLSAAASLDRYQQVFAPMPQYAGKPAPSRFVRASQQPALRHGANGAGDGAGVGRRV